MLTNQSPRIVPVITTELLILLAIKQVGRILEVLLEVHLEVLIEELLEVLIEVLIIIIVVIMEIH